MVKLKEAAKVIAIRKGLELILKESAVIMAIETIEAAVSLFDIKLVKTRVKKKKADTSTACLLNQQIYNTCRKYYKTERCHFKNSERFQTVLESHIQYFNSVLELSDLS